MADRLRVLIVEDSESDAALLARALRKSSYAVSARRVETADQMRAAMDAEEWDIILSDYRLPSFDAPAALRLLQELGHDVPFLVVSATIGEETAVTMMKAGAHDYLMKDNLARLGPAVVRELREARSRHERRRAEAALRTSEARYRGLFQSASDGILILDGETGAVLDANPVLLRLVGVSFDQIVGATFGELGLFESVVGSREGVRDLLRHDFTRLEGACAGPGGSLLDVELVLNAYHVDGRRVAQCSVRDITARRRAENELRQASADLARAQSLAHLGSWTWWVQEERLTWSDEIYVLFGLSRDHDLSFEDIVQRIHPEDRAANQELVDAILGSADEAELELRVVRSDGEVRHVHQHVSVERDEQGRPSTIFGTMQDVSERRRIEEALGRSERAYRDLIENLNDVVFSVDRSGVIAFASPAADGALGYVPEELVGQRYAALVHPDDLSGLQGAFANALAGRLAPSEFRFRVKNGEYRWVRTSSRPLHDQHGIAVGLTGILTDITEAKQAAEALRLSEERFRGVFQAAVDGLLVADAETGDFVLANPRMCAMLGFTEDELLRLGVKDIHRAEDLPGVMEGFRKQAAGTEPLARGVRVMRKDGSELVTDINTVPMVFDGRECVLGAFRDMTSFHELEAQMRQAQKMEAIGRLAGGVAHDFNNILGVILGHAELALGRLHEGDPLRQSLVQVQSSAEKAAALTRQLLVFSRRHALQPVTLIPNDVVRGLGSMIERLIGEDVELRLDLAEEAGRVRVDPAQLEQVLINLAVNARDAMPEGGLLTIATSNTELDDTDARDVRDGTEVKAGSYVELSVVDSGVGMDDTTKQHLFEPFFTTKEAGKGTGLGLSTVYGVVRQAGGRVTVESEPGRGARFRILLPRAAETSSVDVSAAPPAPAPGRGEVVLVVEDEPGLREVIRDILDHLGYRPTLAANAGEAMLAVEEAQLRPDVLLSDIIMPGLSGVTLAERLRRTLPDLKVLFMSGYADVDARVQDDAFASTPLVQKPFRTGDLAAALARVLREAPPGQR